MKNPYDAHDNSVKPVAIFRHAASEGPGYFAEFLDRKRVPWELIRIDQGEPVPQAVEKFAGLCFMGGAMSVNDPLDWIGQVLALIRRAAEANVPVIGHCLGAQLLAKALHASVHANPTKEIGWGEVTVADHTLAKQWFGDITAFESFHWHGETFSLPEGATRIAASPYCQNQIYVLDIHLGMQCHVEMTTEMIESWCASGAREIARSAGPAVMSVEQIKQRLPERVRALHLVADRLYERWLRALN